MLLYYNFPNLLFDRRQLTRTHPLPPPHLSSFVFFLSIFSSYFSFFFPSFLVWDFPARVRITSLPHAAYAHAQAFNQPIGGWDVGGVTTLESSECGSPTAAAAAAEARSTFSSFFFLLSSFFDRQTHTSLPLPFFFFCFFLFSSFFPSFFLLFLWGAPRVCSNHVPTPCSILLRLRLQPAHRGLGCGQSDHFVLQ